MPRLFSPTSEPATRMFTGIIEELGVVRDVIELEAARRMSFKGSVVVQDATYGSSIAVDGVCLTVTALDGDVFSVDVMHETLERSTLGALQPGERVNLERSVRLQDRMSGHLVQGHVDATARISSRVPGEHWESVEFELPESIARYVVEKGSIAVDGVSLTVATRSERSFGVGLIPTTLALTTLGLKKVGDSVNIEVDVVAKYVENLIRTPERE